MRKAFIIGLAGPVMSDEERQFIRASRPAGLILFGRNCTTADQIRALVGGFLNAAGTDRLLVLIDQEGGRVQRLRPPIASLLPPAAAYATVHAGDAAAAAGAARLVARLIADHLKALDINTDCAPVLDLPVPGAHDIIGNRAFAHDAATVIALGRAFAMGLMAGGVLPVMKHIPGHGRAFADSHHELPVVDTPRAELLASDLVPFQALADLPAAMTAHVVYSGLDASAPASTSALVTREIIRGHAGFDGLLMSDDLGMKALAGPCNAHARAVLEAGSDLALHCSGKLDEMEEVADAVPFLTGDGLRRFERALDVARGQPEPFDRQAAIDAARLLLAKVA